MTDNEKKIFAKNLNYYIAQSGKQQKEIAKDIEVNQTTFNMWCLGKSMPNSGGKIQKIADYFGIGKSDLVDEKIHPASKIPATLNIKTEDFNRFKRLLSYFIKLERINNNMTENALAQKSGLKLSEYLKLESEDAVISDLSKYNRILKLYNDYSYKIGTIKGLEYAFMIIDAQDTSQSEKDGLKNKMIDKVMEQLENEI